jgi:hypothetical protein
MIQQGIIWQKISWPNSMELNGREIAIKIYYVIKVEIFSLKFMKLKQMVRIYVNGFLCHQLICSWNN